MALRKVLITGSCGLVGSESVRFFTEMGLNVVGVDNDSRGDWFGKEGSVGPSLMKLQRIPNYQHHPISITNKLAIDRIVQVARPDLIVHCAAQPSHDKSASIPFEDFNVNAVGTMNLLEAVRLNCPEAVFIHVSTNKVYGDRPNQIKMRESIARFWYDEDGYDDGIDETMPIDQSMHSPFGASKAAADLMVQEYGRYFGLSTACFRCGCVTGANHQGVELHGYLSHLCKTAKSDGVYTIYGHKGKQVRDNIHAKDLVSAFWEFAQNPRKGEVYNIGGGFRNSASIISTITEIEDIIGKCVKTTDGPPRKGDHLCYYTNYKKFQSHYPNWKITKDYKDILEELLSHN